MGSGQVAFVTVMTASGSNELAVQVANQNVWTGTSSTAWDVNTSPNWSNAGSVPPNTYNDGDAVLFDDTGSTANGAVSQGNVTIGGVVQPSLVTVNNSAIPYTFSGPGGIGGAASLVKSGNGLLTIANAGNTYTGATIVNGGTLALGGAPMPAP